MSNQPLPESRSPESTLEKLRDLANSLRQAGHLDSQTQQALASLLDELGEELKTAKLSATQTVHLAEAASEVARSLHEQHATGLVSTARDRLKDAAVRAETETPVASGVVYRLLDLLSSLGI